MTVKNLVQQIEMVYGRQPEEYMYRLINDGLRDMSAKIMHYTVVARRDLESYKRWYDIDDKMIDIFRVEILDTNNRYVLVPKLTDPHKLLKGDSDQADGSLT